MAHNFLFKKTCSKSRSFGTWMGDYWGPARRGRKMGAFACPRLFGRPRQDGLVWVFSCLWKTRCSDFPLDPALCIYLSLIAISFAGSSEQSLPFLAKERSIHLRPHVTLVQLARRDLMLVPPSPHLLLLILYWYLRISICISHKSINHQTSSVSRHKN